MGGREPVADRQDGDAEGAGEGDVRGPVVEAAAEHHAAAVHPHQRGRGAAEGARTVAADRDRGAVRPRDLEVLDEQVRRCLPADGGATGGEAEQPRSEHDRRDEAAEREVGVEARCGAARAAMPAGP